MFHPEIQRRLEAVLVAYVQLYIVFSFNLSTVCTYKITSCFAPCITIILCILYCDHKWHKKVHKEVGHCRSFVSTPVCLLKLVSFPAGA